MTRVALESVPEVCDVHVVRGARARTAAPSLLLEVPHGATRAADFDGLRAQLRGTFPADLQAFFFVNTDVGAPEVADAVARAVVAAAPERAALVVRSCIPRTFVDCNRDIPPDVRPSGSKAGEMTPGLHAWVRDEHDRALVLARYQRYRDVASAAFAAVCGGGGLALMVHTYAPRSIDVPVDEQIVQRLRAAYEPGQIEKWPLRAPVDLIARDPTGKLLASPDLLQHAERAFGAAGHAVATGAAYSLHPSTLASVFSTRYPQRTLCLELRRDLLVREFTPFAEMQAEPARVDAMAAPLAEAVLATFASDRRDRPSAHARS